MIDQLTIRGLDDKLARKVRGLAESEGLSLNQAVLKLLRRGAGLEAPKPNEDVIGNSLDWFIGSATEEETRELEEALKMFEEIDQELWK